MTIKRLTIDQLEPAEDNLREAADTDIDGLAASIFELGLMQALLVTKGSDKDKYLIVAGHRRYLAISKLVQDGLLAPDTTINCEFQASVDPAVRQAMMLVENVQRVELNPVEQYEGLRRLATEHNWTIEEITTRTGLSRQLVKDRLSWGKLPPETLERVRLGDMTVELANKTASLSADDIETVTGKNGKVSEYDVDAIKRKAKNDRERTKWIRDMEAKGHVIIDDAAFDRIDKSEVAELDGVEQVAKQMLLNIQNGVDDTHEIQWVRLVSMFGQDVPLNHEFLDTPRLVRLRLSKESGHYSAEAIVLDTVSEADNLSDYDRDVDAVHEAQRKQREDYEKAKLHARRQFLEDTKPATLLAQASMHLLKTKLTHRWRYVAPVLELETEEEILDYASKSVSNLARALAAFCLVDYPRMEGAEVPEPEPIPMPDPTEYDPEGRRFQGGEPDAA